MWDVASRTLHVEVDRLLKQKRRYAVIVTDDVRDSQGRKIRRAAEFRHYKRTAPRWYAALLDEALDAAHSAGVPPGHVVVASVFTTQTITSVMERIRDDIKSENPAPADFMLGPNGERTVFPRADVASIVFRQQTSANPAGFTNQAVNLGQLDVIPGAVGTIAYGRYTSPDYLVHPRGVHPGRRHTLGYATGPGRIDGLLHAVFAIDSKAGQRLARDPHRRWGQRQSACLDNHFCVGDGQPRPGDDRNQPCRAGVRPARQTGGDQDRRDHPRHAGCRTGCRSEW